MKAAEGSMRVKDLLIGLIVAIIGIAILLTLLWNGLTFQEYTYGISSKQAFVIEHLSLGDRVSLDCLSGITCKGSIISLRSNSSINFSGGQIVTVPVSGNYSLDCVSGNCVFKIMSASSLTLAVRYAVSGLGIAALVFAVMLFKASISSRPGRNFVIVGKHVECRAKTMRKHVCIIKPFKGAENLFDIVLDYLTKELNLKLINRKESIALLKGRLGGFWKGSVSVTTYQLIDGSVESEFTFPGMGAEGTIDLERLAKKYINLDKKLSVLEH